MSYKDNIMREEKQVVLDFDAIRLKVASAETIKRWSNGEVTKPETINYRTQKPEKDGLFCEKIFGPMKDWECYCGKYKRIRYKGIICDKCGVEVTHSSVRRERMGHIELAAPISHIWFLRGVPSKIGLVLDMSLQDLEKVVYFASFIVTKVDEELKRSTLTEIDSEFQHKKKQLEATYQNQKNQVQNKPATKIDEKEKKLKEWEINFNNQLKELTVLADLAKKELKELKVGQIIAEMTYQDLALKYGHLFEAGIGAEAVHRLLLGIDLDQEIAHLTEEMKKASPVKKKKLFKRYKLLAHLKERGIRPDWMILTCVPVIPPDLRPMVALDGGRYAASDLNDLYRRVINRNNRLKKLLELNAPEVIVRNEKRMLQEAVDALIDNSARHGKTVTASTGQKRMLKSLADSLKGKQGRFRQNLLGKRVDYSGRSVIVVGPHLKIHQCGLPKRMALELFKPFVISQLIKKELVHNVRSANRYIEAGHTEVYDILENITNQSHVLLNRAPTLHRLGIQAFQPVLIEGKAIQIHPMVCAAFNADFDGDQMAVHVPLTAEAKREASELMLSSKNLLRPGDGSPITTPSQDLVLGVFYLTACYEEDKKVDNMSGNAAVKQIRFFAYPEEAILAYELRQIKIHDLIKVRLPDEYLASCENKPAQKIVLTTVGRLLFNEVLPPKIKFFNKALDKKSLKQLVALSLEYYGIDQTAIFLDKIKSLSIKYLTTSGISWGMDDLPVLAEKPALVKQAEEEVDKVQEQYEMGLLTNDERKTKVIKIWFEVIDQITELCRTNLSRLKDSPVYAMIESGARGSWNQTTQMMGMKGLVNSPSGETIELPVKASFKEGFEVLEYFISTHGARKGLSDTALRTASAGYLTRKLIDVSQSLIITEDDCKDKEGFELTKKESEERGEKLAQRVLGRTLAQEIKDPRSGEVLFKKGQLVNYEMSRQLAQLDLEKIKIRSVLTCKTKRGICAKCYGWDLGYNQPVKKGTAVGIVAAQSIGEPGTQLTMRTFHTGGVAAGGDITQGLPRVEEIFEARAVKKPALMAPIDGQVIIEENIEKKQKIIKIEGEEIKSATVRVLAKDIGNLQVKDGASIKKDELLLEAGGKEIFSPLTGKLKVEQDEKGNYLLEISSKKKTVKELPPVTGTILWVKHGDVVSRGEQLSEGAFDLHELYVLRGQTATQKYVIREIQSIYSSQGQKLNDKHIEIIARQMFSRIFIEDAGDSDFLPGEVVESSEFHEINEKLEEQNKQKATGHTMLLGITKASLSTSSFLSSASFQETARVLIDAAVSGKIDYLRGLKENVIIGRLIPAGTGFVEKVKVKAPLSSR